MRMVAAAITLTLAAGASAHSLSPTRVEAPSGSTAVAYRFNAINAGDQAEVYRIECFKSNLNTPYPCAYSPQVLVMRAKATRSFKAQILPDTDGLYFVCTRQEPRHESQIILTRVCARVMVGQQPSSDNPRKHPVTKSAAVPTRSGQNPGR